MSFWNGAKVEKINKAGTLSEEHWARVTAKQIIMKMKDTFFCSILNTTTTTTTIDNTTTTTNNNNNNLRV